jgi:DNA-binding NarL/FixJ family response regulator
MLKVLVADDHPLFREAIVLSIRHLDWVDFQVLETGSLDEVCRLASAMPDLDLLLLDLKMPGMDGLGGLLELRRRFPALPVVIVSATEDPRVIREAITAGAMAYVPKSLGRSSIAEALRHVLVGETWQPENKAQLCAEGLHSSSPKDSPPEW